MTSTSIIILCVVCCFEFNKSQNFNLFLLSAFVRNLKKGRVFVIVSSILSQRTSQSIKSYSFLYFKKKMFWFLKRSFHPKEFIWWRKLFWFFNDYFIKVFYSFIFFYNDGLSDDSIFLHKDLFLHILSKRIWGRGRLFSIWN